MELLIEERERDRTDDGSSACFSIMITPSSRACFSPSSSRNHSSAENCPLDLVGDNRVSRRRATLLRLRDHDGENPLSTFMQVRLSLVEPQIGRRQSSSLVTALQTTCRNSHSRASRYTETSKSRRRENDETHRLLPGGNISKHRSGFSQRISSTSEARSVLAG